MIDTKKAGIRLASLGYYVLSRNLSINGVRKVSAQQIELKQSYSKARMIIYIYIYTYIYIVNLHQGGNQ